MTSITLSKADLAAIEDAYFASRERIFDAVEEITFTIDEDGDIVDCAALVPPSRASAVVGDNLSRAADVALARYDAMHRTEPCTVIPFKRREAT